jgi:tetratricopeptide (TPR) repeat protein
VDIDAFIASGEEHLGADRLLSPPGANALEDFQAVLRLVPDHQAALRGKERIVQRLIELARLSAQRGSWQQGEDYLDQGIQVSPGSEELRLERQALRDRRMEVERRRISVDARRAEQRRRYEGLVARTREAMEAADWNRAESYLKQAATLPARSESELAALRQAVAARRGEARGLQPVQPPQAAEINSPLSQTTPPAAPSLIARPLDQLDRPRPEDIAKIEAGPKPPSTPDPIAAPAGPAASPEAQPQAATVVEILEAAATQLRARPGETIEFYTRFRVTPPPGRSDAYVVAVWVLKRNGRSLGEPGAKGAFAKAGVSTMSTRFALPPGISAGRYTVEHKIQSESAEITARSQFTVAAR